jgi:hypothetical protein
MLEINIIKIMMKTIAKRKEETRKKRIAKMKRKVMRISLERM